MNISSPENLTTIRRGVTRQWKVTTLILIVLNMVLLTVIIIITLKENNRCNWINELTLTTTRITDVITNSTEYAISTSTSKPNFYPLYYRPYSLSTLQQIPTSIGLSLNHSLYSNVPHASAVEGYITSAIFRLYTNWEGDDPLYIYALKSYAFTIDHITHRYPIFPQRNTTQWQIIQIPWHQFPIYKGYHVAVGMQDRSSTNEIFALHSPISIHGKNITNDTSQIVLEATKNFLGVALLYTVLEDDHN